MTVAIRNTKSRHWTEGGTGVLNFSPNREFLYLRAIEEYGDNNLFVSRFSLVNAKDPLATRPYYSLHDYEKPIRMGLGAFWEIVVDLEKRRPFTKYLTAA